MGRTRQFSIGLAVALSTLTVACGGDDAGGSADAAIEEPVQYPYPGADWAVVEPEAAGIDGAGLLEARDYAFKPQHNTQALLIVRRGQIVGEWYADGVEASQPGTTWSAAKSFSSTLIGIAIDRGDIAGVDATMGTWVDEWEADDRADIPLEEVLRMQSGLAWDEGENQIALHLTYDHLAFSIDREIAESPHSGFNYSSADSMLLSRVIEVATGGSAGDYAREHLFDPIGAEVLWWVDGEGHTLTYCCLDATARDFARFGLLFARGGVWDGEQIVSARWLQQALEPADNSPVYGYQWWLNSDGTRMGESVPRDAFAAQGKDEQRIIVIPSLDLVIVRLGAYQRIGQPDVANGSLHFATDSAEGWRDEDLLTPIVTAILDD